MAAFIKDGGVWKEVTDPSIKDAGTWKDVQEGHIKDSGTWKEWHTASSAASWVGINDPNNQVSWGGSTTVNGPNVTYLSWPAGSNYFKATLYGAGGGNSNGGQGASGGTSVVYLAKGNVVGSSTGLILVCGKEGHYGNPTNNQQRDCRYTSNGGDVGNCTNGNWSGLGGNNSNTRVIGGPGTSGTSGHNWGSGGGGFAAVFVDDNNFTSPQGYRYFKSTPVAIAGGGGGGQAYNTNAKVGGGINISASNHYQSPPSSFTANDVVNINFGTSLSTDGNGQCYSLCRFGNGPNHHPFLAAPDGNCGGGFAAGSYSQGGSGFVYGQNGVHLSSNGYTLNSLTITDLSNNSLIHSSSGTSSGGGRGVGSPGRIIYQFGN